MKQTTIAAITTPIGVGGVGIIKISGPDSFDILGSIFVPKNKSGCINVSSNNSINDNIVKILRSHMLYYGHIIHPISKEIMDEVLVTLMKAPKTYTKEDVVEIQAHSGFVILQRLLSLVLENGAKIAKPGEFTQRAFLNGRIDLTQAEATIDLINAKTDKAAMLAAKRIEGSTKTVLEKLTSKMLEIQATYEGMIEFANQLNETTIRKNDYYVIKNQVLPEIELMLKNERDKILYQDGVAVAIVGIPNVGKSSLMNRLSNNNRSIVSDFPGTTRDIIKEHMIIEGLPIIIHDTAGICISDNPIEKLGIDKSIEIIENADIILFVVDAHNKLDKIEKNILKKYADKKLLIAINKIDSCSYETIVNLEKQLSTYNTIKISAKKNLFIDDLKNNIFQISINDSRVNAGVDTTSLSLRQHLLFSKIKVLLNKLLLNLMDKNIPIDIVSYQIGKCINILDDISGSKKNNDLYDSIFNKFCVGK